MASSGAERSGDDSTHTPAQRTQDSTHKPAHRHTDLDAHDVVVGCFQRDVLLLVGTGAEDLVELPFAVSDGL